MSSEFTDTELRMQGAYKVVEWMRTRNEWNGTTYDADGLKRDLDHSSLIRWLCHGNTVLAEPPPVRFSRPDHSATVNGVFTPDEVWFFKNDQVIIDHDAWRIEERLSDTECRITYRVRDNSRSAPWIIKRVGDAWEVRRV